MNDEKLNELFEIVKEEGLHFASALLAKLAGHVSENISIGSPDCPPGYYYDTTTSKCVKDVG